MGISRRLMLTAAAIGMAFAAAASAAAGEEQTIDAFSVWQARGHMYKMGENIGMFVGALQGPFFIETPEGPVGAGTIICPGILNRYSPDDIQIRGNRTTVPRQRELYPFRSHPTV